MGTSSRGTQKAGKQRPRRLRNIIFGTIAWLEVEKTVRWCDEQQAGLGDRFETEVYATFKRILQNPKRFRLINQTIRKAKVEVFTNYSVYFHVEAEFIGIISIS